MRGDEEPQGTLFATVVLEDRTPAFGVDTLRRNATFDTVAFMPILPYQALEEFRMRSIRLLLVATIAVAATSALTPRALNSQDPAFDCFMTRLGCADAWLDTCTCEVVE